MKEELTLGQKLRFFRTQKGLSQSQLEIESDLSFGTVSRIENEAINPTKETILRISEKLNLNHDDLTYLLELKNSEPSNEERENIIKELQPILDQEIFPGYIIDNKFRIWTYNKMALEIFEIPEEEAKQKIGTNLIYVLFNMYNIINKIPKQYLIPIIKEQIAAFKDDTNRYNQEEYNSNLLSELRQNPLFNSIWNSKDLPKKQLYRRSKFYLKYKDKVLKILITRSAISLDDRFMFIEYFPQDKETAEIFEKIREKFQK